MNISEHESPNSIGIVWDQTLPNKSHGPMFYILFLTQQSNPPISQFNSLYNKFTSVLPMLSYSKS